MIRNKKLGLSKTILAALLMASSHAYALTAGSSYTVTIGKINSNGTETVLSTSSAVVADSDGKIAFSLTGVPDSTTCNFMTVVIKDSTGAVARNGIAPCATAGTTMPLGVSPVTDKQTEALKAGFLAAGTDDPILAVFGLAAVRTTGITTAELAALATIVKDAISNPGGFTDYLTTTRGVSAAQLAAYRSAIVAQLNDVNSGYSKLLKDSVDATASTADAAKRGEAAGLLMEILVKAATTAGFQQDYILEAFNAMGSIAVPAITAATPGTLSVTTAQGINTSIGSGIQKAKTSRVIEKYSAALTTLGATGADVTQFQTAATTLSTSMQTAFSTFEQAAFQTGTENAAAIIAAQTTLNTAMNTAFNTFIADTATSDARILTLRTNICTVVLPSNVAGCLATLPAAFFQFYDQSGTTHNWPVNMVVLTDWVTTNKTAGGSLTYTRDTTAVPGAMVWAGSCSVANFYDQASCVAATGVWTPGRTCFGTVAAAGEAGFCQALPVDYASLRSIEQDVNILQMTRWAAFQASGGDMGQDQTAEQAFTDKLYTTITGLIGGTTNGTTAISAVQKNAIVTLMSPPQM
ncbi:MAG: hypothetical protein Q7T29_02940 [Gallionella sp.]|nr:hypothetical protein [Gallionella sp.]